MYQTAVYQSKAVPQIGTECYIKEMVIGDNVAETTHHHDCPVTNRGHQKEVGWLGSRSAEGTTKDYYARGKFCLVQVKEFTDETGQPFAWDLIWAIV
jgi:hypothetical protein